MLEATDYFAIQNLINRAANCMDMGDIDAVAALFARADIYMPGANEPAIRSNAEALATLYREWTRLYPETGTPHTQTIISNVSIVAEERDAAKGQAYFSVLQATVHLPLQPIIGGFYNDRFAKFSGEWCFVERREHILVAGNLSQRLLK